MRRWRGVFWGIAAVLLAQLLSFLAARSSYLVERLYSRLLYPLLGRPLSRLTGLAPFSLAEVIVLGLAALAFIGLFYWLLVAWRKPQVWLRQVRLLLTVALFAYASFIFLWGLNYYRQPLADILQLEVQPASPAELAALCSDLLNRLSDLRPLLPEDEQQVMQLTGGKWRALGRAQLGFDQVSQWLPQVGGHFGVPKGVMLSKWWSFTGTAGMYFPFTGEANINMAIPDVNIPATACHEMAHQRGFAREDEANYLAYLACVNHPDIEFQYSGLFLALSQSMRALSRADADSYAIIQADYPPGLIRDLKANHDFWQSFSGPVEQLSERMNDAYLKANRQVDGVQSYGRMVDLLLAEWRAATK